MMLIPDKKKIVSIILEGIGKAPEYPKEKKVEESSSDHSIALKDAMDKFLKAIESKDVDRMVSYLKDFVYMCKEEPNEEPKEIG